MLTRALEKGALFRGKIWRYRMIHVYDTKDFGESVERRWNLFKQINDNHKKLKQREYSEDKNIHKKL